MDTLLNILIATVALTIPFLFAWVMLSLKVTSQPRNSIRNLNK